MSEEPAKPEDEFADIPGPPRNPYATLALGAVFGIAIGFVLAIALLPSFSPSIELKGTVVEVDENGMMVLGNARLVIAGIGLENLAGYIIELDGTIMRLRLGWWQPRDNLVPWVIP